MSESQAAPQAQPERKDGHRHQFDSEAIALEIDRRMGLHNFVRELAEEQRADLMAHYRSSPVDWINDWVWTYDPRLVSVLPSANVPMILWPRQEELVDFIMDLFEEGRHGGLKKSRDWGATWVCSAIATFIWLFYEGASVTFGSRKQELVDRLGDPKAIFPKIRHILDNLPGWMLPQGYDPKEHNHFLKLINPANGATITGEAGDEMGRGGRSTLYFVDEAAFLPRPDQVEAAVGGNSDAVLWLSTSNGTGTVFYQKEQARQIPFFYASWRDDPRKSEEWASHKRRELGPTVFAREYGMDDSTAQDGLIVPGIYALAAVGFDLPYEAPTTPIHAGLDVSDEGDDENVLIIRRGCKVNFDPMMQAWKDVLPSESGRRGLQAAVNASVAYFAFDRVGVGSGVAGEIAPAKERFGVKMPKVYGVIGNARPTATLYPDDPKTPAHQRFADLNTELWWSIRVRCEMTYKYIAASMGEENEEGEEIDPDWLISLPNDPVLLGQLTSRKFTIKANGKIKVESKDDMKRRGIRSPDRADALAYTMLPVACFTASHAGVLPVNLQRKRATSRHPKTRRPL